jgi:hypothetical protein
MAVVRFVERCRDGALLKLTGVTPSCAGTSCRMPLRERSPANNSDRGVPPHGALASRFAG